MNIFQKIGKSIYGPDFYSDIKNQKTSTAVGYYTKLSLLFALVITIWVSAFAIPSVNFILSTPSIDKALSYFPEDLTLTIKNKQFSTNVAEPYYVPIVDINTDGLTKYSGRQIDYLAVIDTKRESITPDILSMNNTLIYITKNSVVYERNGSLQVTSIDRLGDMNVEISRSVIKGLLNTYVPYVKTAVWFIPLLAFVGLFVVYFAQLLSFFFGALLLWVVLKIRKMDHGYMYAYRMYIYAQTLAMIIGWCFFRGSMLVSILLAIIVVLINLKESGVVSNPSETQIMQ
jgi:hypothetical protein